MLTILPTTADHDVGNLMFVPPARNNDLPVPFCPYGAIFLKPFAIPPTSIVPRVAGAMQPIRDETFKFAYGHTYHELRNMILRTGFAAEGMSGHIPTRKGDTFAHLQEGAPVVDAFQDLQIEGAGAEVDQGNDLAPEERIRLVHDRNATAWLSDLWNQFLSDILQKCGNSHNAGSSHCRLVIQERRTVTAETYNCLNLAVTFNRVQWHRVNNEDWMKLFGLYWPDIGAGCPPRVQNYRSMKYYVTWRDRIGDLSQLEVNQLRNKLWMEFSKLKWLPEANRDRVWRYDRVRGLSVFPTGLQGPAPRIAIFSNDAVSWNPVIAQGEEMALDDPDLDVEVMDRRRWLGRLPPRNMTEYSALRREEEEGSD
jgi:hypothetical protein